MVHYIRHGLGDPLFLIHDWPKFGYMWHENVPVLEEKFDVSVLEVTTYAEDLLAQANHLDLDRFSGVNHDVGTSILQFFGRQWP
ncbi:MAG: hypothetical protein VYA59_03385 [Pseudomonadota bacterium]|nr:hypothetical protein [Pseudomonadota bacterium]